MTLWRWAVDVHSCVFAAAGTARHCSGTGTAGTGLQVPVQCVCRSSMAKENGGRRQVLCKKRMWEICNEVWDAIPIEELRPFMLRVEKQWPKIQQANGSWVGWTDGGGVRHGVGS
eukprot:SAG31_NODE_19449_length_601_cov_2.374502_1_plen_115_part_00